MGEKTEGMDEFAMLDCLNKKSGQPITKGLDRLRNAKVIHQDVCDKDEMDEFVYEFATKRVSG